MDSGLALRALRNDTFYSNPCTFGISLVGWICTGGFASITAGGVAGGVAAAGFACATDCGAGSEGFAGSEAGLSGVLAAVAGSPGRRGIAFGSGTAGVRLATWGTDAGGRGGPLTALTGGASASHITFVQAATVAAQDKSPARWRAG